MIVLSVELDELRLEVRTNVSEEFAHHREVLGVEDMATILRDEDQMPVPSKGASED
jgi:hypothetical protein